MTTEELEKLIEKAKTKDTGVYSANGNPYAVKNGHLVLVSENGKIFQFSSGFLVSLGQIDRYSVRDELQRLLYTI